MLRAAVVHVLAVHGIDIYAGEWGKPLGKGPYEFRIRRSLNAILSVAAAHSCYVCCLLIAVIKGIERTERAFPLGEFLVDAFGQLVVLGF